MIGHKGGQLVHVIKQRSTISARHHLSYVATAVLLFSICLMGCERRVWENSLDSPDQLGLAVVDALNQKNIKKLNELRVQKQEYLSWIYPAFPKSSFSPDFAWSNLNKKCNIGMKRWIDQYGGRNLSFVNIRFDKPTENYDGFQLLRGTVLTLQNSVGEKAELKILGSVVLMKNRYKLLSYDDG